jgi:alpha-L-fucosidase
MPRLPKRPAVPTPLPPNSVEIADATLEPVRPLTFPIARGPVRPDWTSIGNAYKEQGEDWLRKAKFGIWVHYGPQAAGMAGDWYSRRIYDEKDTVPYNKHLEMFGHPSVSGYKDVVKSWKAEHYDPAKLAEVYKDAGARFLIIQGVHHDNFDNWNSRYHPWNSAAMGPRRDLINEWKIAAREHGMRYGISFHHDYCWWWFQTAFGSDANGPKAGIPYDAKALSEIVPPKGTPDPRLLYGVDMREYRDIAKAAWLDHPVIFHRHKAYAEWYATQWALRMIDAIEQHDPDFIYTDGNSTQPFSGDHTGTGAKFDAMQRVMAHYFNRSLQRRKKLDVLGVIKFIKPTLGTAITLESSGHGGIKTDQPWIGEAALGEWFWQPGIVYSPAAVVRYVIENACRNGASAVCVPLLADGSMEPACATTLKGVGEWMRQNGEGIYDSSAWSVPGESATPGAPLRVLPSGNLNAPQVNFVFAPEDKRFTQGPDGAIYIWFMAPPKSDEQIDVHSLGSDAAGGRRVSSVEPLGRNAVSRWKQTGQSLQVKFGNVDQQTPVVGLRVRF